VDYISWMIDNVGVSFDYFQAFLCTKE